MKKIRPMDLNVFANINYVHGTSFYQSIISILHITEIKFQTQNTFHETKLVTRKGERVGSQKNKIPTK